MREYLDSLPEGLYHCINRDLRRRTSTSTRVNLKFARSKKKGTPKASFYFFSPKKLVGLFILKEVKPSPDSKMIKRLRFDNLFPSLRHSR